MSGAGRRFGPRVGLLAIVLCVGSCEQREPAEVDLLLRGGLVVDGTGSAGSTVDVGVSGDRIVLVGDASGVSSRRTIDVSGLVVAPGFWDNHAHLVDLERRPLADNLLRQGITTVMATLHSQEQPHPLGDYMARVRMAPNVGMFAGHTWIREQVLGLSDRPPSTEELERMEELVECAMTEGALGLATGLEYTPAVYATTDEIVTLARVAAAHGGVYATHLRDEGVALIESVEEALHVGREASMPVLINHHKVTGAAHFGASAQTLLMVEEAQNAGLEVAIDVYPYLAYSTYSDLMFPPWSLAGGAEAFEARVADPATRRRLVGEMTERFAQQAGEGPDSIQFRTFEIDQALQGKSLADYLRAKGRPATVAAAVDALIELQLQGGFIGIFHGMDDGDLERIMRHPSTLFSSDADLVEFGVGHPHPRSYGAFPRVLGTYVRERGVLTLEQAVHKMTGQAAAWWGVEERGTVVEGAFADLVILDPQQVADRATYTEPHQHPAGVHLVMINGEIVLEDGEVSGALPGRFITQTRRTR